jgi:hypothetical protein
MNTLTKFQNMKNRLLILLCFAFLSACGPNCWHEENYTGKCVDKFRTDAGYKSAPSAHIVFYCNELKRNVDVSVTWNSYTNIKVGDNVSFELSDCVLDN